MPVADVDWVSSGNELVSGGAPDSVDSDSQAKNAPSWQAIVKPQHPVEPLAVRVVGEVSEERIVPEVSVRPEPTHSRKKRSAGRNLPAAIAVGLALVIMLLGSIYVVPILFTPLVALAVLIASLEVTNAMDHANLRVPAVPLLVASVGTIVSASVYGVTGVLVSTIVGAIVLVVWRALEATGLMAVRDTVASIFTLLWVPFLASFAILLMHQPEGAHKILLALLVPIANDVGGYIAGVLWGKRPMAPSISPKKSWEGFAGSLVLGLAVSGLIGVYLLPSIGLFWALLMGAVMVVVSTVGDLCESLLKRDLAIKDMGQLLPGHGGVMDRLDSMLLTAPTVYVMLTIMEVIRG